MRRTFLYAIGIMVLGFNQVQAQNPNDGSQKKHRFKQYIHAGFNIGALAPVSLPNTIREVKSYQPAFAPTVGYEAVYMLSAKWGIGVMPQVEYKGMTVEDKVMYFHTMMTVSNGSETGTFEGDFTGTNKTIVNNGYVSLPIYAVFQPGEKWRYKLGGYMALMFSPKFEGSVSDGYIRKGNSLGEKVYINYASFDFAEEERKFDFGVFAGAERSVSQHWAVNAALQWGLRPVLPTSFHGMDFSMYNIFGRLGVSYQL